MSDFIGSALSEITSSILPPSFFNIAAGQQVYITGTDELGQSVDVVGSVAEQLSFNISSQWEPLIQSGNPAGILSFISHPIAGVASTLLSAGSNLTGYSGINPALTQKIWRSTSYLDLSLSLEFNAISDAQADVIDPINQLSRLTLPSLSNGLMRSPGPSFLDINNKYRIDMIIGNFYFTQVIVESVATNFDTTVDRASQFFNSALVNMQISTAIILTKEIFSSILQGQVSQVSTLSPTQALGSQFRSVQNLVSTPSNT